LVNPGSSLVRRSQLPGAAGWYRRRSLSDSPSPAHSSAFPEVKCWPGPARACGIGGASMLGIAMKHG